MRNNILRLRAPPPITPFSFDPVLTQSVADALDEIRTMLASSATKKDLEGLATKKDVDDLKLKTDKILITLGNLAESIEFRAADAVEHFLKVCSDLAAFPAL